MCCGALVHARVANVILQPGSLVLARDQHKRRPDNPALNHTVMWREGLMSKDSAGLLQHFFQQRRATRCTDKAIS